MLHAEHPEIALPFNHYTDLLQPLVAKIVPTLDGDQQAIICDTIANHEQYQTVLTEQFAPFVFYQILQPKMTEVAERNCYNMQLDNVNCVYQGLTADWLTYDERADTDLFAMFMRMSFDDEFSQYESTRQSTKTIDNVVYGLSDYLIDKHFNTLQAMFEPLLNDTDAEKLVHLARLELESVLNDKQVIAKASSYGYTTETVERVFIQIYGPVRQLVLKQCSLPSTVKDAEKEISFSLILNYVISNFGEFGVDESYDDMTHQYAMYAKRYFADCAKYLADGAVVPIDLYDYIKIMENDAYDELQDVFKYIDSTVAFYVGDTSDIDPKYSTIAFTTAISAVSNRFI